MSLSLSDREKLVTLLQRKFPLANQWGEVKSDFKACFKSAAECVCFLGITLAGLAASIGFFYLTNGENRYYIVLGGFLGCAFLFPSIVVGGAWCSAVWSTMTRFKISKKPKMYKPKMRDYVSKNNCAKKINAMLPHLSDYDLNLLRSHPNFNTEFDTFFEKEFKRRSELQTIEKINTGFLSPLASVEIETPTESEKQKLLNKVNI